MHSDRQERQISLPSTTWERVRRFLSKLGLTKAPEAKVKLLFQQGALENNQEFAARAFSRILEQNPSLMKGKEQDYQAAVTLKQKLDELHQGYPTVKNLLVDHSNAASVADHRRE
jgi:hypothetical protein